MWLAHPRSSRSDIYMRDVRREKRKDSSPPSSTAKTIHVPINAQGIKFMQGGQARPKSHMFKNTAERNFAQPFVCGMCAVWCWGVARCATHVFDKHVPPKVRPILLYSSPLWPHSAVSDAARPTSCADLAHCINHTVAQSCAKPHPMVRPIPAGDGATAAMHESRAAHSGGPACGCA